MASSTVTGPDTVGHEQPRPVAIARVDPVAPGPPALAGALAAGVAIAASELVAGVVRGAPSLVVAIGSLVISLQPPGAKDVMVNLFGTNDKLVLNVARRPRRGRDRRRWPASWRPPARARGGRLRRLRPDRPAGGARDAAGLAPARGPERGRWRSAPGSRPFGCCSGPPGPTPAAPRASMSTTPSAPPGTPTAGAPTTLPAGRTSWSDAEWARRRFLIASAGTLAGAVVVGGVGRIARRRRALRGRRDLVEVAAGASAAAAAHGRPVDSRAPA